MTLEELRRLFRLEMQDQTAPYFWKDEEVDQYLNDAEEDAARRSGLLVDSSSSAAEVDLAAGDAEIDLHESVIYVRRVRLSGVGLPLVPRVVRSMDEEIPGWEDASPSTPQAFVPDWESGKLRLYPPTDHAVTAKLTVIRTPLQRMESDDDKPELPPRTHRGLVYGAMEMAYLKQDADTFDSEASKRAGDKFTAEFGPPVTSLDEHWALEQYYDVGYR